MDVCRHFKKYDYILNNKKISPSEKIRALLELWAKISKYDFASTELNSIIHLTDWAVLHSMNLTLSSGWQLYIKDLRTELLSVVENAFAKLIQLNPNFKNRCEKLIHVIVNTWTNPTLKRLMNESDLELGTEEIDFFNFEQAHLISVRLMKLCDSSCGYLALNLASAFLNYLTVREINSNFVRADQVWFIFDVKVALLFKLKKIIDLQKMLKALNNENCIYFLKRFIRKKPNLLNIWKYSSKICTLALQIFLPEILQDSRSDTKEVFAQLIEIFTANNNMNPTEEFCSELKKLCDVSNLSTMDNLCVHLKEINNPNLKSFIVEIFIKCITAYLNELEFHKNEQDVEKFQLVSARLASIFCNLAEYMNTNLKISRECILTAFSLDPSRERLETLEMLAKKSGLQISNLSPGKEEKFNDPSADEVSDSLSKCNENMDESHLGIRPNLALHDAIQTLDLPEPLCDDLIICISNPRYQILSWYLPWNVLHKLCLAYLKDPKTNRNFSADLKFLKIDYSMFQEKAVKPLNEYEGIEKGYEKYLKNSYTPNETTHEETDKSEPENCAIEGEDYDPNSIESLKKILGIQNSTADEESDLEQSTTQEGDASKTVHNRNPRSILKPTFEEHRKNKRDGTHSKSRKRKLHKTTKEKHKKKLKRRSKSKRKHKQKDM